MKSREELYTEMCKRLEDADEDGWHKIATYSAQFAFEQLAEYKAAMLAAVEKVATKNTQWSCFRSRQRAGDEWVMDKDHAKGFHDAISAVKQEVERL